MVRERSRVQSSLAAPFHPLEIAVSPCVFVARVRSDIAVFFSIFPRMIGLLKWKIGNCNKFMKVPTNFWWVQSFQLQGGLRAMKSSPMQRRSDRSPKLPEAWIIFLCRIPTAATITRSVISRLADRGVQECVPWTGQPASRSTGHRFLPGHSG